MPLSRLVVALLCFQAVHAQPPHQSAINACDNKSDGDQCDFQAGVTFLAGHCDSRGRFRACKPDIGPNGRPIRANTNQTLNLQIDTEANQRASKTGAMGATLVLCVLAVGTAWAASMTASFQRELTNCTPEPRQDAAQDLEMVAMAPALDGPMSRDRSGSVTGPQSLAWCLIDYYVDIRTVQERLSCKSRRKQILHNVHGYAKPGTVTAIMGPSGSGKTTLLNVIAGRSDSGWLGGVRVFNGQVMRKAQYELKMSRQGYVLQTDTFFPDLTVREMLTYCAMLRIGEKSSVADKLQLLDKVLCDVNLVKQAHSVIGGQGSGITGISGGQRRRLSVAIELLTNPCILILDEPTSGLDATSSHQLVTLLQTISRRDDRTILLTIHQPRAESFQLFDQLLLLGEGGCVTYHGAAAAAVAYLAAQLPHMDQTAYDNPGDFIIDAVGLDPARTEAETTCMEPNDLAARYVSEGMQASVFRSIKSLIDSTPQPPPAPPTATGSCCGSNGTWHSSIRYQVWVLFARRTRRMFKRWKAEAVVFAQLVLVSLVLGYAMVFQGEIMDVTGIYQEIMFIFCSVSYLMILQYLVSVPEAFEERPVYLQDRLNRSVRPSAYVLSSVLTDTPRAVLHCLVFYVVSYYMVGLNPGSVYIFYTVAVTALAVVAWQAVVGLCSSLTDNQGVVYSMLFVLFGAGSLFGGLCIPYDNIKTIFKPFYYLSVPAWGYRSILINDLVCCHLNMTCDDVYTTLMDSDFKKVRDMGENIYADCLASNGTVPVGQLAVLETQLASSPEEYDSKKLKGVVVLLFCVVVLRWLSMVTLRVRTKRANFLQIVDEEETLKRLRDFQQPMTPEDQDLCS